MALPVAQAREKYGADLRERLRSKLIVAQLCNTNFTGDVVNSRKVIINSPAEKFSDNTDVRTNTAEEGRNPVFAAPKELTGDTQELVMDQGSQLGISLGIDDLKEATWDMVADANDKISDRMAYEIDYNLIRAMRDGIPGSRADTNPQKPAAEGKAADYIDGTTGIPSSGKSRIFVVQAFLNASAWALGANIWKVGEIEHELWAMMHPLLWRAVQEWIFQDKPSDSMVNIFGGGPRSQLGISTEATVQGGMLGMNVFLNPNMIFEQVGGKNHFVILFGTRQFMTFAARPVLISSKGEGEYQAGETIGEVYHGFQRYGRKVVNPEQMYSVAIRAEA